MNKDFIEDNKTALIEEISTTISSLSEIIKDVSQQEPQEPSIDNAYLRNYFMAVSQNIGYLVALYNQYYILLTGNIEKDVKRPIGFSALNESIKKKKMKDDEN